MRDDLLDAQAVIDWAITDIPHLQQRIDDWISDTPYKFFRDFKSDPANQLIRLRDVKTIPRLQTSCGSI